MPVKLSKSKTTGGSETLQLRVGAVEKKRLLDEPQEELHGVLTAELVRILERADPSGLLAGELEGQLRVVFQDRIRIDLERDLARRPLFTSVLHSQALALLEQIEQAGLRQAIEALANAIEQRQQLDDPWPEGRLNLGIAYATAGDFAAAQRSLEEAVDLGSGKDLFRQEAMMAA